MFARSFTFIAEALKLQRRQERWRIERSVGAQLDAHFGAGHHDRVVSATRTFPSYLRVDLNRTLERLLGRPEVRCLGLHTPYHGMPLQYSTLVARDEQISIAPLQLDEVDIGEDAPVRCLRNGLWLVPGPGAAHVVLLVEAVAPGNTGGWQVEIVVPAGEQGDAIARRYFDGLEEALQRSSAYRGKILSLEQDPRMMGMRGPVTVHRLAPVARDEVILPAPTLELLERNVFRFAAQRAALREMGLPLKKGLLFYGAPGTGKTHTIRYLSAALAGHTTFLMSAEQVGLIGEYMRLARLLSPALVVIEDVDLIGRQRETMHTPWEHVLLNRLLNEMDGLKDNTEILFILTTNQPETLESALTARPGRIDQAIEFPLPGADGRRKLARLYAKGAPLPDAVLEHVVERTAKVSASFIKELMRRAAQFALERGGKEVADRDVDGALDELLFSGGRLNAALLGALGARE